MKGVTSGYTVNDLLRKRTEYRDLSQKTFAARMPDDVQITGFSIVNIGFPPEYTKAIRDKQVAREQAETEQYVLDRQRLTTTQVTQTAMAQRDADKARADGRAYEIKVQGEATADAIRIMGEALAKNPLVVEYKKVERWGGSFPDDLHGRRRRLPNPLVPTGPNRHPGGTDTSAIMVGLYRRTVSYQALPETKPAQQLAVRPESRCTSTDRYSACNIPTRARV